MTTPVFIAVTIDNEYRRTEKRIQSFSGLISECHHCHSVSYPVVNNLCARCTWVMSDTKAS